MVLESSGNVVNFFEGLYIKKYVWKYPRRHLGLNFIFGTNPWNVKPCDDPDDNW